MALAPAATGGTQARRRGGGAVGRGWGGHPPHRRNTRRGAPSARAATRREEGVEKEEEEGSRRRVEGRRYRGAVAPPWPRRESWGGRESATGKEETERGRERRGGNIFIQRGYSLADTCTVALYRLCRHFLSLLIFANTFFASRETPTDNL